MSHLPPEEAMVAAHYDRTILSYELERLERHSPVEAAITLRCLGRWIADGSTVADIGVGAGVYAEELARRGCRIVLIDVSEKLLEATRERLRAAGFEGQIAAVHRTTATGVREVLAPGTVDAALLLGPLYHLRDPYARRRAVEHVHQALRPGGLIFAAGVNRLAFLRDLFREHPGLRGVAWRDVCTRFLADGQLDPETAPPIGYAHLTTVEELRALLHPRFHELAMIGVESFTTIWQARLLSLSETDREAWLDLVDATSTTAEGLAASDHFLFVGRAR